MILFLILTGGVLVFLFYQLFQNPTQINFFDSPPSSDGERRCREWLQNYFNLPFTRVRPDWLKNPKYGRNLELDCYNESLMLAVEYNGRQHYSVVPQFHKNGRKDLNYSKYKDALKKQLCAKHGVHLIVVPFTQFYNIEHFLEEKVKEWETLRAQ